MALGHSVIQGTMCSGPLQRKAGISNGAQGKRSPLPRLLMVNTGAYHTALSMLLVYMVQSYGVAESPQDIGKYTGVLAALSTVGRICTALLWGWLSDYTGRRPLLIFAELVAASTAAVLAFTPSFQLAGAALLVYGFFHGTIVISKSTIADLSDGTNQSLAFGLVCGSFGVGSSLGPLLGGLLSQPCQKGLLQSCPPLLASHPFALPFLFFTFFSLLTAISTCFLQETSPRVRPSYQLLADSDDLVTEPSYAESKKLPAVTEAGTDVKTAWTARSDEVYREEKWLSKSSSAIASELPALGAKQGNEEQGLRFPLLMNSPGRSPELSRDVLMVALLSGLLSFTSMYAESLFSVYAAAPTADSGLGYDSSTMGVLSSICGAIACTYTLTLFPSVSRRLSPLRCIRLCFLSFALLWLLAPFLRHASGPKTAQWGLVFAYKSLWSVLNGTCYSSTMMVVSNAGSPSSTGMVIGLSMTVGSVIGTPAPAIAGWLWSTFTNPALQMPLGQFVPWGVLSLASSGGILIAMYLPQRLNAPDDYRP